MWQFKVDEELRWILRYLEKFPGAFLHWIWGSHVFIKVCDPDYMKVILGRAGESEFHPSRQVFSQVHVYSLINDRRLAAKIWEVSILLFPTAPATAQLKSNNTH